jgi:hypothetical protein
VRGKFRDARRSAQMLTFCRFDFTTTSEVIVRPYHGEEKRFPVYRDLLTSRSGLLLAARNAKPQEPADLYGEDLEVFSLYLNCIHSGTEAVRASGELLGKTVRSRVSQSGDDATAVKKERDTDEDGEEGSDESSEDDARMSDEIRFEALIKLHHLAAELQDLAMANLAADEIVRMVEDGRLIPREINLAYSSLPSCPLRDLFRDIYIHGQMSYEFFHFLIYEEPDKEFSEFLRDVALECLTLKTNDTDGRVGGRFR